MTPNFNQKTIASKAVRSLLWLLIGLPVLAIVSIVLVTGVSDERVLKKQARQLLVNRTSESAQYAHAFLDNVHTQVKMSNNLFDYSLLSDEQFQELENYYIIQLELQPIVAGLYTSNLKGDFFYVSRSIDPSKGKYRVKLIKRDGDTVITHVWWRDESNQPRKHFEVLPDDGFDSRQRPWFIDATTKKTTIWTDPYVFFTTKRLGVTIASPYTDKSNKVLGAIGIDVELTQLASFLDELDQSRFGSSFIVTEKGTFIADASFSKDTSSINTQPSVLSVNQSDNVLIKKAYGAILSGDQGSFVSDEDEYLVETISLKLEQSVPWYIVSYANKNDFLREISANNKRNYWIAGLVTLLSMILGWYFARLLSRPVLDLEELANRDQLTGLYNRRYLNTNTQHLFGDFTDDDVEQGTVSFAIIDIDNFKKINDAHGHDFGDDVLKIFSKRLKNMLRDGDIFIRLGGEEFLLILPDTDSVKAKEILDSRRVKIGMQPFNAGNKQVSITFSAGIVERNEMLNTFENIYKVADEALYQAKKAGRNQVVIA